MRVSVDVDLGQLIDFTQNLLVARVRKLVDYCFKTVVQVFHSVIHATAEEDVLIVWRTVKFLTLAVVLEFLGEFHHLGVKGSIVGFVNNNLLLPKVTLRAKAEEAAEEQDVGILVKDYRVAVCHYREVRTTGQENQRTHPRAEPYGNTSIACHFEGGGINNEVGNKDEYTYHGRHTQSALTDNRAQGSTDKEEEQARKRQRHLLMPFQPVAAHLSLVIVNRL